MQYARQNPYRVTASKGHYALTDSPDAGPTCWHQSFFTFANLAGFTPKIVVQFIDTASHQTGVVMLFDQTGTFSRPCANNAQMTRAILLASATGATFTPRRSAIFSAQRYNLSGFSPAHRKALRAP